MTQAKRRSGWIGVPAAKLERAKEFAARALAAYNGYASTRKVKTPEKTRSILKKQESMVGSCVEAYIEKSHPAAKTALPMIGTGFIRFLESR